MMMTDLQVQLQPNTVLADLCGRELLHNGTLGVADTTTIGIVRRTATKKMHKIEIQWGFR